jgi:hypothetical protein
MIEAPYYKCATADVWSVTVGRFKVSWGYGHNRRGSHKPRDWACTCAAFKRSGRCRHVDLAREMRCGWDMLRDGGIPVIGERPDGEPEARCPWCLGPIHEETFIT